MPEPTVRYVPPALRRDVDGLAAGGPGVVVGLRKLAPLSFTEADLSRACAGSAAAGREAALASVGADRDRALASALSHLEGLLDEAARSFANEIEAIAARAAGLVATVAADPQRRGDSEVRETLRCLVADTLAEAADCPRLSVHAAADLAAAIAPLLEQVGRDAGRADRLTLTIDPTLPGDAIRLTWTSGWAEARAGQATQLLRDRLASLAAGEQTETTDDIAA